MFFNKSLGRTLNALTVLLPLLMLVTSTSPQANNDIESKENKFSIYLVRHAEKQAGKDPMLTACGQQRADQLAVYLADKAIKRVYSTNTKRTLSTAKPSATAHSVEVTHYSHKSLDTLATQLKAENQNALVVGHSNTTPQLAGLLADKSLTSLDEKNFDMLYIVSFDEVGTGKWQPQLAITTQGFACNLP